MTHDNTSSTTDLPAYVALRGGMRVERELVDAIGYQVASVLRDLTPGTRYTARQLCGFPFWGYFSRAERRLAGRCLVPRQGACACTVAGASAWLTRAAGPTPPRGDCSPAPLRGMLRQSTS